MSNPRRYGTDLEMHMVAFIAERSHRLAGLPRRCRLAAQGIGDLAATFGTAQVSLRDAQQEVRGG